MFRVFLIVFMLFNFLRAQENINLQLSWKNQFQFAGYYMAKEKGFYNDVNLNVNIKEYDNGINASDDVVNGKADFGVGRSSLIRDRYEGKPIVILAAIFQHSPVMLLTKKRDDITKIEDLKNKKIMLSGDLTASAPINAMLQSKKVTKDMFTIQTHSFNIQDLIDGKTDAMLSYVSNEPYALQKQNIPYTIFSPRDYNFDFYSDILFTSSDLIKKKPELVKAFREASLKGWKYALKHKEETVDLILKNYNTQKRTKDALLFEANEIEKLVDKNVIELGNIDPKRIEYISQIYSLMGFIDTKTEITNFIYKAEKPVKSKVIKFTAKEKEFIKNHPIITLGADQNWKPFDWKDNSGNHAGFDADFTRLLEKKLNINIEVKLGDWDNIINDVKEKKINGIMGASQNDKRDKYMVFTEPYFMFAEVVLVEKDNKKIFSISDLDGKTIALKEGSSVDIDYFNKKYPNIKQKLYNTDAEIIIALSEKKVDAALSNIGSASYEIERNFISNVKVAFNIDELAGDMRYGIRNDQPELASIIQKGIDAISKDEIDIILGKWVKMALSNENLHKLNLTEEEIAWLDKKIPIKYVYDPDWAPFEWKNELGEQTGIVYDLLNLIKEKSGIKLQQISTQKWSDSVSLMESNKADMYSAIGENEEQKKYVNFTKNVIFKTPYVLVSRANDKNDYLETFQAIENKKVAVVDNYTIHTILKDKKPNTSILTVKNLKEGFDKVRNKSLDIFIVNAATAKYFINTKGYEDLKIATKTEFDLELKIALQKDLPDEVISILDKAIDSISDKERADIYYKWVEQIVEEIIDYTIVWRILIVVFVIIIVFVYYNRKLKKLVNEKTIELQELVKSLDIKVNDRTEELNEQKEFVQTLLDSQEQIVITTDGKTLRSANKTFLDFFNVNAMEEFTKEYDCICDRFKIDKTNTYLQKYMGNISWIEYVIKNNTINHKVVIEKDDKEKIFSVSAAIMPIKNGEIKSAVFTDITELENQKKQTDSILASVLLPMLITSKKTRKILYANSYAEKQYETTINELLGKEISMFYTYEGQREEILSELNEKGMIENFETIFKTAKGKTFDAILSLVDIEYEGEDCFLGVASDITNQKELQKEIESIHKHTRESIEYAALIQSALIPDKDEMSKYFKDQFIIWHPKDTVGGDIYLFDSLRNNDECLFMVIDCTGHGVPGAFVTMLVKAIERQITSKIKHSDEIVSPAKLLAIFNKNMKQLLKQETIDSISNAGFDGGIVYYNKKEKILKYAGANVPLFYIENNELKMIKADKYSVGYKKCDVNYKYKEHSINIKEEMQFYLTTDGYLDQNGGKKGFPFGKKQFSRIIEENKSNTMEDQKNIFLEELIAYQLNEERNDDVTVVGFKI